MSVFDANFRGSWFGYKAWSITCLCFPPDEEAAEEREWQQGLGSTCLGFRVYRVAVKEQSS